MEELKLGFAGDVMLGRNVNSVQKNRPPEAVWGELLEHLNALDGFFINLECCISDKGAPWTETPRAFHFRADPDWAIEALEKAGVDWCNLANNHILDYGEEALVGTLKHLAGAGIKYSGADRNQEEAFSPAVVEVGDLKLGFVSFSDHPEAYASREQKPGIAYIDLYNDGGNAYEEAEKSLTAVKKKSLTY